MKLSSLRGAFPWRMALLLALIPCIPLLFLAAWFQWELPPLQRYYLRAYWDSSEGAKQPGETQIQWLFKAAPGRKRQPVIDTDVAPGGTGNLSLELSPSALEQGWTKLEKGSPQSVPSVELEELLQDYFYGNRSFRQLVAEPLLDGCAALLVLIFPALTMWEQLKAEWRGLRTAVSEAESEADSAWDLPLDKSGIIGRIRSHIARWNEARKLRRERVNSLAPTSSHARDNRTPMAGHVGSDNLPLFAAVRQTDSAVPQAGNPPSPNSPKRPPQRHSIFPGAASVRAANEEGKPWDKSEWID